VMLCGDGGLTTCILQNLRMVLGGAGRSTLLAVGVGEECLNP